MLPLLLSLACYKNTITLGPAPGVDVYEAHATFVMWGAAPDRTIDMDAVCPTGVARIEEQQDGADMTLSCFTLGFVQRVSVRVICADGTAWNMAPDPELGGSWVTPEEG